MGGGLLLVVGVVLLVLPGPGLLLVLAGLLVLANGFPAAQKFVDPVERRAMKAAEESVSSPLRMVFSIGTGVVLIAAGVVWWVVPGLPLGGWPTGCQPDPLRADPARPARGQLPAGAVAAAKPTTREPTTPSTELGLTGGTRHVRSTRRSPRPGCHDSTTSAVPSAFRAVTTTSCTSARNSSPSGSSDAVEGLREVGTSRDLRLTGPGRGIVVRWIAGGAVQREPRVAVQVGPLAARGASTRTSARRR